ncbi:NOT2 / NOT3 / NOT5 family protein [Theileria parva strain Muguga]|uniref:NOT2/NOT3/NOT5 C-terminal domain-containing protein n=1 Tax=Theileria parva TaxID=5875 RepID=Q4N2F2_THEPA|nr:NOT2 / NOT3 / NOT5 family protein [Theileria parva strain Muguga]EAN31749.1 NOT2 / NOT3 / NOT5 family protein [Theileria parva strain Muguga]|eukprot:XP_764032.1 hypothetical protein [Theileria parva strain Muguga]
MGLEEVETTPNEPLPSEILSPEEAQKNEISQVSDSFENLNFVDRNITDLKRELSSKDKEEITLDDNNLVEADTNQDKTSNLEAQNPENERDTEPPPKPVNPQNIPQEHFNYGLEGIFDAMKSYFTDKSPFLPTGKLDTEALKHKLLQDTSDPEDSLDEESIFFDRFVHKLNYGQTLNFRTGNVSKLSLETLFYVFYNVPRDNIQSLASIELYKRLWKYHESNKLWFKHDQKKSLWVYFDPATWGIRSYNVTPEVENALLSRAEMEKKLETQE